MKRFSMLAWVWVSGVSLAALTAGCSGSVVDVTPPGNHGTTDTSATSTSPARGGSSTSGGSYVNGGSASSGSVGSLPPPGGGCGPGIACQPNSGCATASAAGSNSCAVSCNCGPNGVFVCQTECADSSLPTGCSAGAPCSPNTACGSGSAGGCSTTCTCDSTQHLSCTSSCPAVDAGCVETVLCIAGDHFDTTQCRCVPDACISQQGGPCGGLVANPCQCAPGLVCLQTGTGDGAGTCEPQGQCRTASDCSGPLPLLCAICADGGSDCAHWSCVNGQCQTAYCH